MKYNRIDLSPFYSGFYKYNGYYGKNVCRRVFFGENVLKGISLRAIEWEKKRIYNKFIKKYGESDFLYYTVIVNLNYIGSVAYIISDTPIVANDFEIGEISNYSMTEVKHKDNEGEEWKI